MREWANRVIDLWVARPKRSFLIFVAAGWVFLMVFGEVGVGLPYQLFIEGLEYTVRGLMYLAGIFVIGALSSVIVVSVLGAPLLIIHLLYQGASSAVRRLRGS